MVLRNSCQINISVSGRNEIVEGFPILEEETSRYRVDDTLLKL